jgi:hypothetical protein
VFNIFLANYPFQLVCEPSAVSMDVSQVDFDPDIWGQNPIFALSSRTYLLEKLESRQADSW